MTERYAPDLVRMSAFIYTGSDPVVRQLNCVVSPSSIFKAALERNKIVVQPFLDMVVDMVRYVKYSVEYSVLLISPYIGRRLLFAMLKDLPSAWMSLPRASRLFQLLHVHPRPPHHCQPFQIHQMAPVQCPRSHLRPRLMTIWTKSISSTNPIGLFCIGKSMNLVAYMRKFVGWIPRSGLENFAKL